MQALLLVIVGVVGLIGLAVLWWGVRGRLSGRGWVCARCDFDLSDRFPWNSPGMPICPDCGARLLEMASVRRGRMVPRRVAAAVGVCAAFPALVILGYTLADQLAGGLTAGLKSSAVLAGQVAGSRVAGTNLRVLSRRVLDGKAGGEDLAPAIARALELQADRTRGVDEEWVEFLETCRRKNLLTLEQTDAYFKNSLEWSLLTAPTEPGQPLSFSTQALVNRLGTLPAGETLVAVLTLEEATFGRQALSEPSFGGAFSTPAVMMAFKPGVLMEADDQAGRTGDIGHDNSLSLKWRVELRKNAADGPTVAIWTQSVNDLVLPEEAMANRQRVIRAPARVTKSPGGANELSSALTIRSAAVSMDADGERWLTVEFAPAKIACDVIGTLKVTGRAGNEWTGRELAEITPSDERWRLRRLAGTERSPWRVKVSLGSSSPLEGVYRLEITPPKVWGTGQAFSREVWGGEPLVFEGVQIRVEPEAVSP